MTDTPELDVVERVRSIADWLEASPTDSKITCGGKPLFGVLHEAAATITSLRAQLRDARAKAFEDCAAWHDTMAYACRHEAENVNTDWIPYSKTDEDRRANIRDRDEHYERARYHEQSASAIRARAQQEIGAEGDETEGGVR